MKEIGCIETNFTAAQIKKVKPYISEFGFCGGMIYYMCTDENLNKLKAILGKSVKSVVTVTQ